MSPARTVAFDVLRAVEEGGFASDLLLERSTKLDSRDAGLASEIVFGVLRRRSQLDSVIRASTGRAVSRLDAEVRIALRMGLYQLLFLDRVPAHAAVTESVELVKRAHKRSAAGLVNAVLRKAPKTAPEWPDRATALSAPAWLLERWDREFGAEAATRIAEAFLAAPATYIRVPAGVEPPAEAVPDPKVSGCYRVENAGHAVGFRCQDAGSQAVVPLLALEPEVSFLDLCAAPGNKTAQALETPLRAVACDISLRRVRAMVALPCPVIVADATQSLPFRGAFDRILVDAPCSGSGTIGRNPEIRWRLKPEDLEEHQRRQVALLRNALGWLKTGGRLVYSTCSLEREENDSVIEEAVGLEYRVVETLRRLPGRDPGDGFFAAAIERC